MKNLQNVIRNFWMEEDAISTVEIVLIIVVLIGLVIIFKSQLTSLVSNILSKITSKSQGI
ncbi:MAG: Flp1 family type IVb pilin [Bilifractor sp.]|jgi:Flp pilus assembly pilin Flp